MNFSGKHFVVTGGAGFIGTNLTTRLLKMGYNVVLVDNLSRKGSRNNLNWLANNYKSNLQIEIRDVLEKEFMAELFKGAEAVFHFAAQVAVTKSILNPIEDFKINLQSTLNILEILRNMDNPPFLVFTSTNKVYGNLSNIELAEKDYRYTPVNNKYDTGVNETTSLDFKSPYGCSKGSADQYILDYSRTYLIPATVFRMSCIYGPHQFGTEDQGWVAYFLIKANQNEPITIYGNGKQVRDILFIDDLVEAFLLAVKNKDKCSSQAFTIGGGPSNSLSLLEFFELIKKMNGYSLPISFAPWRNGDQCYYVSDISKYQKLTGWKPVVSFNDGIQKLNNWIIQNIPSVNNNYIKEKIL